MEQDLENDNLWKQNHIETEPKMKYKRINRSEADPRLKSNLCHSYHLNYDVSYTYVYHFF